MKIEHRVILISSFAGLLLWILDAAIDHYFFITHDGSFFNELVFSITRHKFYFRSVILIIFLAFGLIVSRMFTHMKKSGERIVQLNSVLRAVQTSARIGSFEMYPNKGSIIASEETRSILGIENANITFPVFMEKILPEFKGLFASHIESLISGSRDVNFQFRLKNDACSKIIDVNLEARFDPERDVIFAIIQDISNLNQAQEDLRISEERYRLLAENTLDVIWLMDLDLKFLYVNPAIKNIFDYSPQEFIGTHLQDHCSSVEFERIQDIITKLMNNLENNKGAIFETNLLNRTGKPVPVEVHGKILTDENSVPIALQGVTRDISAHLDAQREKEHIQKQLNQSQKMEAVGRLAGGVAHDFNNMLNVISGYTSLALMKLDPQDPLFQDLSEIDKAAQRSAELTKQLLTFSRKQAVQPKVINLNQVIANEMKLLERIIGENIRISFQPGRNLWEAKLDQVQITQVLSNLAVNSRDAIVGNGVITISTKNMVQDADNSTWCEASNTNPGQFVLISFSDSGCGMSQETSEKIFEPFFTTKEKGKGTGLGLSMVYSIVKQNSGMINVESEPGEGTRFNIFFPRFAGVVSPESDTPAEPLGDTGNKTILIVEDQEQVLAVTEKILSLQGYTILKATSPGLGCKIAAEFEAPIDLLLTDVIMPEMNGRELQACIKKYHKEIKTLFMSGYSSDVISEHGVLFSDINFLQKPFSMDSLSRSVRDILFPKDS